MFEHAQAAGAEYAYGNVENVTVAEDGTKLLIVVTIQFVRKQLSLQQEQNIAY